MLLVLAWVLVRYKFPGKRIIDALVDLPFALPTAVAGINISNHVQRSLYQGFDCCAACIVLTFR